MGKFSVSSRSGLRGLGVILLVIGTGAIVGACAHAEAPAPSVVQTELDRARDKLAAGDVAGAMAITRASCAMGDHRACQLAWDIEGNPEAMQLLATQAAAASEEAHGHADGHDHGSEAGSGAASAATGCGDLTAPECFLAALGRIEETTAPLLLAEACERGYAQACITLGEMLAATPQGLSEAGGAYRRGCRAGSPEACGAFGRVRLRTGASPAAMAGITSALDAACNGGDAVACSRLELLVAEMGEGEPLAAASVVAAGHKALDNGDAETAAARFGEACDAGGAAGCVALSALATRGEGIPKSRLVAGSKLARGCELGMGTACQLAASNYASGRGAPMQPRKAARLFATACGQGRALACVRLGEAYLAGHGLEVDGRKAAALFERACDAGELQGCISLSSVLAKGVGVDPDPVAAEGLLQDACERGVARSCTALARGIRAGLFGAYDPDGSRLLFLRGCEGGHPAACGPPAWELGMGRSVSADPARAVALARRGCDGDDASACYVLALFYREGIGVPQRPERARALAAKSCAEGHEQACGVLEGLGGAPTEVLAGWASACELGTAPACMRVGTARLEGWIGLKERKAGAGLLERACDLGFDPACTKLGMALVLGEPLKADEARGIRLVRLACVRGDGAGCNQLGFLHQSGQGVEANPERARAMFARSCEGGFGQGCVNLGLAYANTGVPEDVSRGAGYLRAACDALSASGCWLASQADAANATDLLARACELDQPVACQRLEQ